MSLPQVEDPEQAARIVAAAHEVCPYSNATRGNIDVNLTANGRPVESLQQPLRAQLRERPLGLLEPLERHPAQHAAVFENWMAPYSTTCTRLPHGSRKSSPRPPRISAPASSSRRRTAARSSTTRPKWRSWSGPSGSRDLGQHQELVAHVDEGHARYAAAQLELEQAAVELERRVEVAHLEHDVVDPHQSRHGRSIGFAAMEPAIELDGLERRYGERLALAGVTISVPRGATLAVLGANGAGKTTLLRVLAGLLRPHGGTARVLGAELPGSAGSCPRRSAISGTSRSSTAS